MRGSNTLVGGTGGWVALLLAVAVAGGCGGPDDESAGPGVSASVDTLAGGAVRIHTPAEGIWDEDETWRLVEEVRIGTATGGGPAAFADVRGLAVDALGRVWVLDTEAVEIRVFGADGGFVRSLGREGEGPGEVQYPNGLAAGPDGRIHVFDPRGHRIVVYDTAGRHVADHRRTTGGWGFLWRGGFTRDGRLFDYRAQQGIVVLGPELAERDTVETPPSRREPADYVFRGPNRRGGRTVMTVPFLGRPGWKAGPDGLIWSVPTRPYRFYGLSPDGDTLRVVEREYEPVPVTPAERDSVEEQVRERYAPNADIDLSRIPETKPAVEEVFFDPEGHLWARPYMPGDSTGYAFDVFDPEGRYLGRVRAPVKLRRWPDPVVRGGRLYGVTVDELDVPYVVGLRIENRQ